MSYVICDNAFNIAKSPKYDGYQWFTIFLIKSLLVILLKVKLF